MALGVKGKAVFHTHQHYSTALACAPNEKDEDTDQGIEHYKLQMVQQNCARFFDSIVYDREFNGIVDNDTEGIRLGNLFLKNTKNRVMSMRHHGVCVVGPSCAEAIEDLYYFEISCRL